MHPLAQAARTLRLGQSCRAVSWRALALCRGRAPVVSQPVVGRVADVSLRTHCRVAAPLGHDTSLYRNKLPAARRVACCIARLSLAVSRPKGRPSHDTIFVSRHSPRAGKHSRTLAARPARKRVVLQASWPCRGRAVAVSWLAMHAPCAPVSCYVTIQSVVS